MFSKAWQHLRDHFVPNAQNNYTPHLIRHRSLSIYTGFLFSLKVLTVFSLVFLPQNQALSSELTTQNILNLTNDSRQAYGLQPVVENRMLDAAAQAKAEDMLNNQYFAHNSPQGLTPWDFIKSAGYNYIIAGENLAVNYYTAEGVSQAWMQSPEHRANILNKDFQDIGIGVVQGQYQGSTVVFVVQEFGTKIGQPYTALANSTNLQTQPVQTQPANLQSPQAPKILGSMIKPIQPDNSAGTNSSVGMNSYLVSVNIQGSPTKVLASVGDQSFFLQPNSAGVWQGVITAPSSDLQNPVAISAYDLAGNITVNRVSLISNSLAETYGFMAAPNHVVNVLGHNLSVTYIDDLYWFVILAVLIVLLTNIAVKKHIQHLDVIAETSGFVLVAIMILLI